MYAEDDPLQRILALLDYFEYARSQRGSNCPYTRWLQTIGEADHLAELHFELRRAMKDMKVEATPAIRMTCREAAELIEAGAAWMVLYRPRMTQASHERPDDDPALVWMR